MTAILFAPHNDDESLFAFYQLMLHRPKVVVCFRSDLQERRGTGITAVVREEETDRAMNVAGCDWEQWPILDSDPERAARLSGWMSIEASDPCPRLVIAPLAEENGHEDHNIVANAVTVAFQHQAHIIRYATYQRGCGRTVTDLEMPCFGEWWSLKDRAMACYESQISEPSTAPWFTDLQAHREWLA